VLRYAKTLIEKPKPTKTINPLHFEDLEPHRFEDLIRQLIQDFRNWDKLEPTGRLGDDEGYDARGIDVVAGSSGREERLWQVQCKREKSITPKKIAAYLKEMIPFGTTVPHGVILAAACDFSKKARDVFRDELQLRGVREFYLWGKADIEDLLYRPKNDHLLSAYFGISLQGERPSLAFVIGVPLGDNKSPEWIMMLNHYGPNPAYNCDVHFYDKDRKNIEHEWLVRHPSIPFPPPGLAGQSQLHMHIPEADPPGPATSFRWTPLDPDRQHYSVSISCRDGIFEEDWEVTRVNGILRTRISIQHGNHWKEKNPNSDPVVFACSDPEFVPTPLVSAIPGAKLQTVHPGWKPNHKFDLPVAIIDPNNNIQLAGVKLLDGRTIQGCGCWNILTRHLGDRT
jgi:hypothetical protein